MNCEVSDIPENKKDETLVNYLGELSRNNKCLTGEYDLDSSKAVDLIHNRLSPLFRYIYETRISFSHLKKQLPAVNEEMWIETNSV